MILDYENPNHRRKSNFDYMDWIDWAGIALIVGGVVLMVWISARRQR